MEKLNAILERDVANGNDTKDKVLGAAFVVTNRDCVIYSGGAGRIGFDVDSPKYDGDSFNWVASLSKLPSTICLLQLVEQGRVGLDDDLRELVPELGKMQILRGFTSDEQPILEKNDRPITLRHLLTHTTGLGYDIADPDLQRWSKAVGRTASMRDTTKEGYNTPLKFAPGDGWWYGSSIDWAGILLEKLTGQRLGEYMKQHVLDPMGMLDTGFRPEKLPQTASRRSEGGMRDGTTGTLAPFEFLPAKPVLDSAGTGIFTTANDFARALRDLLQPESSVLSADTVQQIFTPQLNEMQSKMLESVCHDLQVKPAFGPEYPEGLKLNHGFGAVIAMEDIPGQRRKGSISWSGANNPRWWIDRESGIAAVFMVNVLPHGDALASRMFVELERAVYQELIK